MIDRKRKLTELDVKYITSILGRTPSEIEINFIELKLTNELNNREYLQILSRLNEGAKREINNKIVLNDRANLIINNGYRIYDNNNSLIIDKDETAYCNNINNLEVVIDDIAVNGSEYQSIKKIIKKESTVRRNHKKINGRFVYNPNAQIVFSTSIGIERINYYDISARLNNALVYRINFGKKSVQKNIIQLSKLIDAIKKEDWFILAKSVNWNGLGVAIIDLINEYNCGINITQDIPPASIEAFFTNDPSLSVILVIQQAGNIQFDKFCKNFNEISDHLGILTQDTIVQIAHKNETYINLPTEVFKLQYNVNTRHFKKTEHQENLVKTKKKVRKNTSYNDQLLALITAIKNDEHQVNPSNSDNEGSYGIYSANASTDEYIVFTHAEKNRLIDAVPRLSGRISVANAVRRLSCTGAKPIAVVIQNLLPEISDSVLWQVSELFQGQEEAVRELEVEIGNRSIESFKDHWYQNISAVGIHKQNSIKMDISLKNDGDFISLLGSLRGELGGSAYEQFIATDKSEVLPTVDLQMEKRLQDVVNQGINTSLIKSAVNINAGGIAIAIAKSLAISESGFGARIHLSRKLSIEELLFGETQGLVIVSLAEEDIMEFERICMTVGVPSTTIGRVTNTGIFTFNEAINVKVDKLSEIVNL